jgi:hypothetical protein
MVELLRTHQAGAKFGPAPLTPTLAGRGLGLLAALALTREAAQSVSDWLTWRTRIGKRS